MIVTASSIPVPLPIAPFQWKKEKSFSHSFFTKTMKSVICWLKDKMTIKNSISQSQKSYRESLQSHSMHQYTNLQMLQRLECNDSIVWSWTAVWILQSDQNNEIKIFENFVLERKREEKCEGQQSDIDVNWWEILHCEWNDNHCSRRTSLSSKVPMRLWNRKSIRKDENEPAMTTFWSRSCLYTSRGELPLTSIHVFENSAQVVNTNVK